MSKHVVVIYAHPDDESFGAAGTITKFRKQGIPVTFLCGTSGEMGRNMGSPPFANRETLPKIREQELAAACQFLDIDYKLLGYRDKTIEYEDTMEVAEHVHGILQQLKPSLVITHYPGHAVHPDHDALGAAAIEAIRLLPPEERPVVWAQAITNTHIEDLGQPDIVHDITNHFNHKMQAIMAHKSQAGGMIKNFSDPSQVDPDLKEAALKRLGKEQFYIWDFKTE
ncbi:MAG TPA: bacillithiol biosynthesis deacetylase BshB2 [Bacillota bacterium]|nr:bacillithiol biosynthesis deacetylase BshB2 [Bacillota bacterium]